MRRRPQPSVRRGLLRAAGAVIGLTIVLLALILVISTLTAPKAKAPTVPSTPTVGTPRLTPGTVGTPHPAGTRTPVATSGKKRKKSSMLSGSSLARRILIARGPGYPGAVASPNGRYLLRFEGRESAYAPSPLTLIDRTSGRARRVGQGDALVRPVWSKDSSTFMYARVAATRVFPGARWTIVRGSISGQTALLARQTALSVVPLGWSDKAPLYLAATATDTSLYSAQNGHSTFRTILIPQVVTGASLSPDGHTIAFAVPTGCGYCTVDLFDLRTLTTVYGPSGWGSQWNYAWTADGRQLVTSGPKGLAVIDVSDGSRYDVTRPKGLGRVWPHAMRATVAHGVRLTDTVTGATYTSAS